MNTAKLDFPEDDARELGNVLKDSDYQVDLLLGRAATQKAIREKLAGLNRRGEDGGVVLLGFFGHGVEVETRNDKGEPILDGDGDPVTAGCFCPYDTVVQDAKDGRGNALLDDAGRPLTEPDPATLIKLADVLSSLRVAGASNRVVLFDCCRTIPNRARGRSFGASFQARDLPQGTAVLFGCSPNEKAFEHADWKHGAFTKCLLEALPLLAQQGKVRTGTLSDRLRDSVPALVASVIPRKTQTPRLFATDTVDLQLKSGLKAGDVRDDNSLNLKLVWCPPGSFTMGSPKSETDRADNEDQVAVTLTKGFWLGKHELTQSEWKRIMGTTLAQQRDKVDKSYPLCGEGDSFPMYFVSHDEAVEFCVKFTAQERQAGRLPAGWSYTLPTEAQWEYACRAGNSAATAFGEKLDSTQANFDGHYPYNGANKGNAWGLYDMHGNVYEWCRDVHVEKLPGGTNPEATVESSRRPCRGGSWLHHGWSCRSACRDGFVRANRENFLGFRLACSQWGG